jgi:hypothetical protein
MSLFEEQLKEMQSKTQSVGVTRNMVNSKPVSDGLLGLKKP